MDTNELLQAARAIIANVPFCFAITTDRNGESYARLVQTSELTEDWTLCFMTDRRTRKVEDIERSGRLTLAYQYDPWFAYVTLVGRAAVINDVAVKRAIWRPASLRWHPGGPTDPNVVLIDFRADRIEVWSRRHRVVPDPSEGLWAAALTREPTGWRQHSHLGSG